MLTTYMNNQWTQIPSDGIIKKTATALEENGITTLLVNTRQDAELQIKQLIPKDASVMNGSSTTLREIGFLDVLKSGSHSWNNLHEAILREKDPEKNATLSRLATTSDYFLGSVHAVTENGTVVIASNSGSQLPAYAYGAKHVIWIVGAQKIVKNLDDAMKRIYEYVLPLESERAKKAYGAPGSNVSKVLIINKEVKPGRITMVIVREPLGF